MITIHTYHNDGTVTTRQSDQLPIELQVIPVYREIYYSEKTKRWIDEKSSSNVAKEIIRSLNLKVKDVADNMNVSRHTVYALLENRMKWTHSQSLKFLRAVGWNYDLWRKYEHNITQSVSDGFIKDFLTSDKKSETKTALQVIC